MDLHFNRSYKFWPYIIVVLGVLLSAASGYFTYHHYEEKERLRLESASDEIVILVKSRMATYEQVLKSGVGFFKASDNVSRNEWAIFAKEQKINENFKGIQGFGYAEVVLPNDKGQHEARIRKEGFSSFKIRPDGQRELYTSIIYLEPFDERNKRAFGYDMFSEKVRRVAMTKAMRSGEATLSGKIKLLQEYDKNVQAGFLMYLPVYKKGSKLDTPQDRVLATQGFVYAPFRANDLMDGVLGLMFAKIDVEIYDGDSLGKENLLYDANINHQNMQLLKRTNITVNGRTWTLIFKSNSALESENIYVVFLITSFVLTLTLFLYLFLNSLIKAKERALQATQKLQASEERLRFAMEGAGDGLWDWNLKTNDIFYSKRWMEMLGYEENEITCNLDGWESRVHPQDIKQAFTDITAHIEGKSKTYINEHRIKCKDGSYKWILSRGMIVSRDSDGVPIRMVGAHTDISMSKEMEKKLETYSYELETKIATEVEKNRIQQEKMFSQARHAQMGEMIGMIAHQWRQPLNAMSGTAVNLSLRQRMGMLNDEDVKEASKFIQNSAQKMSETIDDFMNFFNADSEKEFFRISDVLGNVEHMVDAQLKTHSIKLEITIDDCLELYGSKNNLTHVLLNLILNARDALNAQTKEAKKITIRAYDELDSSCSIKVIDNGGGIDVEIIDKIFNPYFTTKEQGQGTGIGLHMAKEIIERNFNGAITVHNTEDGAEFILNVRGRI